MAKLLLPLSLLAALAFGFLSQLGAGSPAVSGEAEMVIYPFGIMREVRRADLEVPMQVQLNNVGSADAELLELRVQTPEGEVLTTLDLEQQRIEGDQGFVRGLYRGMESVDPDFSHRHRNRLFIPLEERQELGPDVEVRIMREITEGVAQLQRSGAPQLAMAPFALDLAALFGPEAQVGDVAPFELVLSWRDQAQALQETRLSLDITLLPQYLPPPPGRASRGTGSWVTGDLHVHNCRDEAVFGCDSCPAESVNITGAFTNADLKTQYLAMGMDFFSSTSHSYCISAGEFNSVLQESSSLTDPSFVMMASTEVSARETGPQQGSDAADLFCTLGFGRGDVLHMGAHNVTSQKEGGQDDLLDFCDSPLYPQSQNLSDIRGEGGFAIANHPASTYWAFNSVAEMKGMERRGFHGVEVWNGSEGPGFFQTFHRDWWVDRLTDGLVLYPYSGSDTHDSVFDFGVMHTYVNGALTPASLDQALQGGRSYLSNGPYLEVELRDNNNHVLPMGGIAITQAAQIPPNYPVTLDVPYNVGTEVGTLTVYRGVVGVGETAISTQTGLTGAGTLAVPDTLPQASCWYRAEFHNNNFSQAALTTQAYIYMR